MERMEPPYMEKDHQARLICNDPAALAYEWIKAYAENISSRIANSNYSYKGEVSVNRLLNVAWSHLSSQGYGDYIDGGGATESESTDPVFWDKFAIYYGIEIPDNKRSSFFSCAC